MRIAMISSPFVSVPPEDYGGTELVVYDLVEALVAGKHQVTLFATGDSRTSAELRSRVPEARWPPDPYLELDHVSWALSDVAREGFDVVHVHSPAALAVARPLTGLRLVYTLHHPHEPSLSDFYQGFPEVQFVAISKDQAARESHLPRLRVIHHGLDPDRYECVEQPADYVCFVGRLNQHKGPHIAIDAAAAAGVPIRVAGSVHPPDRPFAEQHLTDRLKQPHVRFVGPVGMKAKTRLLRDARALLAPIEWEEPFGLILVEAMLSGCPVVAFPRGSVPELVDPGITGLIVESAEEMAAAIAPGGPVDRVNRRRCVVRARRRFSSSRMADHYEQLYARVAAHPDPSTRVPITAA